MKYQEFVVYQVLHGNGGQHLAATDSNRFVQQDEWIGWQVHVIEKKAHDDALKMLEEMAGALGDYNSRHVAGPGTARQALENYRKWKEGMK